MPPMTDEIKSEIAEIDFNVSNLLLKIQGNYCALSELYETLSDCLDSCEMDLHCIRIIPDGGGEEPAPRAIGLTDLPLPDKHAVLSTAITSTVAIKVLSGIFNCEFEQTASHIRTIAQAEFGEMSPEAVEEAIKDLAIAVRDNPSKGFFCVEIDVENSKF